MKRILFTAVVGIVTSITLLAAQPVFVVWPWGMGDSDAQISRSLMNVINQEQTDLNLLFENKSGAGASIAAMYVSRNPNTVLAASSAFFVRPNFYSEGVHKISDFRPLILICSGPMLVMSGKYSKWSDVPTDKPLTIGLAGPGTTSHLVAELIRAKYPLSTVVSYRSTNEPMMDAISGNVDFAVGFIQTAEQFIDSGRLHALGITGPKSVRKIPSLRSQGFANADVVVNHHSWLVSKNMPEQQFKRMQELAKKSISSTEVRAEFNNLYCDPQGLVGNDANVWFDKQVTLWKNLSEKTLKDSR
jgi:tripartite-type tricarboxylate transporter receptor subunit TctC